MKEILKLTIIKSQHSPKKKWTAEIWKELLKEGEGDLIEQENVNLIHIPDATAESDSKPPEGYKFKEFGPSIGGDIFNELLSTATTAYKMTASRGKNMSSMMTNLTIVGNPSNTNIKLAEKLKLPMTYTNNQVLIETIGCCDTGADVSVTNKNIRKILGEDKLPDAEGILQGCTGTTDDRRKDKLRVVTCEKKIVILESRIVDELGSLAPDSLTYQLGVKKEFKASKDLSKKISFNQKQEVPTVLVGLKNGQLLSKQLEAKDLLEMGLEQPIFSPDLLLWKTSLNEKLIPTGSIGVNSDLVETESNFQDSKSYPNWQKQMKNC